MPHNLDQILRKLNFDSASEHLPSDAQIDAFEVAIGAKLPPDFRYFLNHFGYLQFMDDTQIIPVLANPLAPNKDNSLHVASLYGLNGGSPLMDSFLKYESEFPIGQLVIGEGDGSLMFCLNLTGQQTGTISLCVDFGNHFYVVAPSFTDFLSRIFVA